MNDMPEPGAPVDDDAGAAAARDRLEALLEHFGRLTPDELSRIGIGGWDDDDRDELLAALELAAQRTERETLVAEARRQAREAVLLRYSSGSLHPTWVGLNWGISQGRVEDRVGIVEALSDAAAATVLADVLEPDVYEALSLPAEHVVAMSAGMVSEGALGRQLAVPDDPDLRQRRAVRRVASVIAGVMVFITLLPLAYIFELPAAPILALLAAVIAVVVALRR